MDLTDSVKHHSTREIQRTQHLLALDNIKYLSNNKSLSEVTLNYTFCLLISTILWLYKSAI